MHTLVFVFTLVFIFFIPWESIIQLPALGGAVRIMGIVMAIFWLLKVTIKGQLRRPQTFHIVFYIFVAWNVLSVFWSSDPDSSLGHIVTWIQLLILVIIFWDIYTKQTEILAGLQAYIIGAYVAIFNTIYNYFLGSTFYYQRFSAVGTNPDDLGAVLTLGIPMAWYLASSFRPKKMSGLIKVINYAYIPAALLGISLTGTRTAIIAAIPGMAYGLYTLKNFNIRARIIVLVLLMAAILALLPFLQTLPSFQRLGTTTTELSAGDMSGRTGLWLDGISTFEKHPFIGIGTNMYRSITSNGKVAHNSFISVLVELGLIGFLIFGLMLAIVVIKAMSLPKSDSMFWLTLLLALAISASTLTFEHRKPAWLIFSLVIACCAISGPQKTGKYNRATLTGGKYEQ